MSNSLELSLRRVEHVLGHWQLWLDFKGENQPFAQIRLHTDAFLLYQNSGGAGFRCIALIEGATGAADAPRMVTAVRCR